MRSKRWFFSRRHERFVSISQGGLSTFKIDRPHDSAILDTRKDLPFEYVDAVEREGKTFVVRRRRRAVAASIFFLGAVLTKRRGLPRKKLQSRPRRRRGDLFRVAASPRTRSRSRRRRPTPLERSARSRPNFHVAAAALSRPVSTEYPRRGRGRGRLRGISATRLDGTFASRPVSTAYPRRAPRRRRDTSPQNIRVAPRGGATTLLGGVSASDRRAVAQAPQAVAPRRRVHLRERDGRTHVGGRAPRAPRRVPAPRGRVLPAARRVARARRRIADESAEPAGGFGAGVSGGAARFFVVGVGMLTVFCNVRCPLPRRTRRNVDPLCFMRVAWCPGDVLPSLSRRRHV